MYQLNLTVTVDSVEELPDAIADIANVLREEGAPEVAKPTGYSSEGKYNYRVEMRAEPQAQGDLQQCGKCGNWCRRELNTCPTCSASERGKSGMDAIMEAEDRRWYESMLCDYCGHERSQHSKTDGPCEECAAMPKDTTAHQKAWHTFENEEEVAAVTPLCTMCGVPGCEGGCPPSYAR